MASKEPKKEMEYNFVSELSEEYTCQICMKLLNEPQLTDCCGQHFCRTCLDRWFQRQGKKQCPHCRSENFMHILNKEKKRKINELKVYCLNREKGCGLTLKLEELERHLSTDNPNGCGYIKIWCPNKCSLFMLRKDMEEHCKNECLERKVRCKYCNEVGSYLYITTGTGWDGHVENCQEYPVNCPNICGATSLKRKELRKHREICPLQTVECPFHEAGCKQRVVRRDLDNHIQSNNQEHLLCLMKSHTEVKKYNKQLQKTMKAVASKLEVIQKSVKDRAVVTSLEELKTTLNPIVLRVIEEGDQMVFRTPCDSWDWVSPIFTLCDTEMYLKTNPPRQGLAEEYYGTLSLILVSGYFDGQYEIHVEGTCEDWLEGFSALDFIRCKKYDPNIKLCTKCSNSQTPKSASIQGREIGRTSLPQGFQGRHYKSCKITLTLKGHHCH